MVESRESSSHHQFVPTISELIAAQMDATGRSYRELAKASGDRVKYQTFQELRTAPPKSWPKNVETIRGMAAALDVSETAVVLGYARSLGVEVQGESMLAHQLPSSAGQLTPAQRNAIVSLIRSITTEGTQDGTGTEEEQESRTQARGPEHSSTTRSDRLRSGASMTSVKVTRLTPKNQGSEVDSAEPSIVRPDDGRMPPPDQLREDQILAARTTDDTSGMYPEDTDD